MRYTPLNMWHVSLVRLLRRVLRGLVALRHGLIVGGTSLAELCHWAASGRPHVRCSSQKTAASTTVLVRELSQRHVLDGLRESVLVDDCIGWTDKHSSSPDEANDDVSELNGVIPKTMIVLLIWRLGLALRQTKVHASSKVRRGERG